MKTLATAILVLLLTPNLWAEGFGNQETGNILTTMENYVVGGIFAAPSAGTLDSIKMLIVVTTESHLVRLAIYEWNGSGISGDLVDSTEEIDVAVGESWRMFHFQQNASISSGSKYSLVGWGESTAGGLDTRRTNQANDTMIQKADAYSGAWPSTVSATGYEAIISVYCYYTEGAPPEAAGAIIFINQ